MVHCVWFKRDLRVEDHSALVAAAAAGPVLPVYIVEPDLWRQPDVSGRQFALLTEAVESLSQALARLGTPLVVRVGEAVETLARLHAEHGLTALHAHEETGNSWTYARDRRVAAWARAAGVPWHETPQFGVVRRLRHRDGWAERWDAFMARPLLAAPQRLAGPRVASDPWPTPQALGLADDPCLGRQAGGRAAALALLASFLNHRARGYQRLMSSPRSAETACSRLSAHLALGSVSLREVTQAAQRRLVELRSLPPDTAPVEPRAIQAFLSRLHWHCHFIQKLETEPAIETRAIHPAFRSLSLGGEADPALAAWSAGKTGFPFVDACMRSLKASGWINFRMRAMLVAFASYHLALDWRATGHHLARLFVDYEPGIHWPQVQMQSGTTSINTLRIYNPTKQSHDQDPDGRFIRAHVPELARVPPEFLHEPWSMPSSLQERIGVRIGIDYPAPIVDHLAAARLARERITALRRTEGFRAAQDRIVDVHGSRRSDPRDRMMKLPAARDRQLDFGF